MSDVWKIAFNKRQLVMQEHESLSRTALQSAMEVFHLKGLVEATTGSTKQSAQALTTELVKLGLQQVIGGSKVEDDEAENGSLTAGFIGQALAVHRTILGQPRVIELLMELESRYGTRSCFHKMSKLHVLGVKPASAKSRVWVLECLNDWLLYNLVKVGDISKMALQGDRTHAGFISLFETKQRAT